MRVHLASMASVGLAVLVLGCNAGAQKDEGHDAASIADDTDASPGDVATEPTAGTPEPNTPAAPTIRVDAGVPSPTGSERDAQAPVTNPADAAPPSTGEDASLPTLSDAGPPASGGAGGGNMPLDAGPEGLGGFGGLGGLGGATSTDAGSGGGNEPPGLPQAVIDVAELDSEPDFFRVYGAPEGNGSLGVPVAAGGDLDGDGFPDVALSAFQASPLGRVGAGRVYVVFGTGSFAGSLDLAASPSNVLHIYGEGTREGTGSQLAVADVDGDGNVDLLLCRQNYRGSDPDRVGAGAMSIVFGGPALRTALQQGGVLDLAAPPPGVEVTTFVGQQELDRLGIWVRAGDITGDGIEDFAIGADQENGAAPSNSGAVYVVRGGGHLRPSQVVDLQAFGATALAGHIAKVVTGVPASHYHLGATVHLGDLDRNGRAELVAAAALVRSGASYYADGATAASAVATAGAPPGGRAYVIWDDNFPQGVWPAGYTIDLSSPPGPVTQLLSNTAFELSNRRLGEELLAGGDYDADGRPDLFIGDMVATSAPGRTSAGAGFLIYDAAMLRTMPEVTLLLPPPELSITTILGASSGAIATDTVRNGDFDGDGITDLVVASPNASPERRVQAGTVHVLWGTTKRWPSIVDLRDLPSADLVPMTEVRGAKGGSGADAGDMLAYSAEVFDLDGDGLDDLVANEMGGNGLSTGSEDSGNLVVLSGSLLSRGRPDCNGVIGGLARIDACGVCSFPTEPTSCVGFGVDVQPILFEFCAACHGSSGGLSVFSYDLLMSGGSDNGPVVHPGDPAGSVLYQKLLETPPFGDRMPPDATLSAESIGIVWDWIAGGARDN